MSAADRTTVLLLAFILAVGGLGVLIACNATSVETQAMEVRDELGRRGGSGQTLGMGLPVVQLGAHPQSEGRGALTNVCLPPRSRVCQRPPRNVQETVRRTLNHAGLGWAWRTWACIAYRESRWQPGAVGDHGLALGLFQIRTDAHPGIFAGRTWSDPADNAAAAVDVYHEAERVFGSGWQPWGGGC